MDIPVRSPSQPIPLKMKLSLLLPIIFLVSCKSQESESSVNQEAPAEQEPSEQKPSEPAKKMFIPRVVTYGGPIEGEESEEKEKSEISDSMSKVIAANTDPPGAVPMDEVKPAETVAEPVPGRPGFVYNPWTNKQVDVRGLPPGTLVRDPDDRNPDHRFRIPEQ